MYGSTLMWVSSFVWWQVIAATSISAGYHRYFSHSAFKVGSWYGYYVQCLGIFANAGPVLTWAASHRMHHRYFGTNKDPHSPIDKGFLSVYLNLWGYTVAIDRRMLRGLITQPSVVFFYNHYFKISLTVALVMFVISPMLFIFGYCVPIVLAFHGYGLINAYTHRRGDAENSALANVLTGGEGWHKNHHMRPADWQIGERWYEIDTGAWFIKLIKT